MMRAMLPILLVLTACSAAPALPPEREAALAARSALLADAFQSELQGALKGALASGGPAAAIEVCAQVAPAIAERLSAESGAQVRRTALKPRNPAAKPDAFERETMTAWRVSPLDQAGKPMVRGAGVSSDEGPAFRWMRAIPTQKMCLQCHGETIAPEVAAAIAARYPEDRATGFREGELRGALSIRWTGDALKG
jgi:hypothetical protein